MKSGTLWMRRHPDATMVLTFWPSGMRSDQPDSVSPAGDAWEDPCGGGGLVSVLSAEPTDNYSVALTPSVLFSNSLARMLAAWMIGLKTGPKGGA